MRRALALLLPLVASLMLSACIGEVIDLKAQLRSYIAATEHQHRQFAYVEQFSGTTTRVTGVVGDDYRYTASVSVNGQPAYEEVVADDVRAAHFDDPAWLSKLKAQATRAGPAASNATSATLGASPSPSAATSVGPSPAPAASPSPATGPASSAAQGGLAALQNGSWVVDRQAGSKFQVASALQAKVGADPLYDALNTFNYLSSAIDTASAVQKFNPEATNYRPQDDPFPRPSGDAVRYDLLPGPLPPRKQPGLQGPGQQQQTVGMDNFRRVAVYVQNGLIVEFREAIDIKSLLQDPRLDLIGDLSDEGIQVPAGSLDTQVAAIVAGLNRSRAHSGQDLIRMRMMTMTFTQLGVPQEVALPPSAVEGSLAAIVDRGQVLQQPPP